MRWSKWSFWLLHTLVFSTVYLALLLLPMTQWRDALPAKPAFYRWVPRVQWGSEILDERLAGWGMTAACAMPGRSASCGGLLCRPICTGTSGPCQPHAH